MNPITVSRRHALIHSATLAATASSWTRAAEVAPQSSFLLSQHGCGRATGYAESNKIVTVKARTHVAWLDSPADGFRVRIRTLDHRTDNWTPTYTIGQAYDNHGGPALTIDSKGFLHVVYYPHHHAMRYRKSKRPGDASEWQQEVEFGQRLTYPTLVCGKDDTLYCTARRSFTDRNRPWQVEFWALPPRGSWRCQGAILQSRFPGYSHFQESLAWGPDHRTLHLGCRFHEKTDGKGYGRLQTVAYLVSPDAGRTWQHSDGTPVSLPVTADSADVLSCGGVDHDRTLRAGALAVDADGRPHLVYSLEEAGQSKLVIARPGESGSWNRIDLSRFVPHPWSSWNLMAPAGVTFTSRGQMVVTAQTQQAQAGESTWGNPSNEVVALRSDDSGQSFSFTMVSTPDPTRSQWLPNIERATGHHGVSDRPGLIYTSGGPGSKNTQLMSNNVVFCGVDASGG